MRPTKFLLLSFLLFATHGAWATDVDNDGSDSVEEALAGTSDNDPAQRPYWWITFNGDSANDAFGYSVSGAGDVNNDGYADLIGGGHGNNSSISPAGYARVFSGQDGSVLYTFHGDSAGDAFGFSVSDAGDVNGDGYADLIVGASKDDNNGANSGSARVFSGMDGSILYTFNGDSAGDSFGASVSGAGDVNNDGYADLIVSAPGDEIGSEQFGSARVFSGQDGSILYTFTGASGWYNFAGSASAAGDVNNDGYADLIVGARTANSPSQYGAARVFSGQDGSVLFTFYGGLGEWFGNSVSGAGDVNGDGRADLIVGAWQADNNGPDSGAAYVFSGADGSILYTFNGDSAGENFGGSVNGAGDVNNDGYADLVVSSNDYSDFRHVRVFSGVDGGTLYTFDTDSSLGHAVSGAGDVNNDGFADLVLGGPSSDNNGTNTGAVRVILSSDLMSDRDLDYWINTTDNCPEIANFDQADGDNDNVGDLCDNCISVANPGQEPSAINPECGQACVTSNCTGTFCENH